MTAAVTTRRRSPSGSYLLSNYSLCYCPACRPAPRGENRGADRIPKDQSPALFETPAAGPLACGLLLVRQRPELEVQVIARKTEAGDTAHRPTESPLRPLLLLRGQDPSRHLDRRPQSPSAGTPRRHRDRPGVPDLAGGGALGGYPRVQDVVLRPTRRVGRADHAAPSIAERAAVGPGTLDAELSPREAPTPKELEDRLTHRFGCSASA
jgi:hypothetical protein